MPFFSINVLASVAILVEAPNEQEAVDYAFAEADFTTAGHKETDEARELKTQEDIDCVRRHADQVITTE